MMDGMCSFVSPVKSNKKSIKWPKFSTYWSYFDTGISVEYVFLLDTCGIYDICLEINGYSTYGPYACGFGSFSVKFNENQKNGQKTTPICVMLIQDT